MNHYLEYLPQHPGLLPKWLLLVSVTAIGNAIQAYFTMTYTQQIYPGTWEPINQPSSSISSSSTSTSTSEKEGKSNNSKKDLSKLSNAKRAALCSPATPLSSRTLGTWTFLSGVIRFYAAYNITDPIIYQIALWTYIIASWHFVSEWLIFRSASMGRGLAFPVAVGVGSMIWMLSSWGYYVES
ncbi:ergosterol biosynthesis protein [Agyrium rufum]|nr:ergosterol biosynthesis protein [Agyrium rufum]